MYLSDLDGVGVFYWIVFLISMNGPKSGECYWAVCNNYGNSWKISYDVREGLDKHINKIINSVFLSYLYL